MVNEMSQLGIKITLKCSRMITTHLMVLIDGKFNYISNIYTAISRLFFFSIEHKGIVGKTAKVGIWCLMITFGAAFGYTVMGRIALLAIRLEFLMDDWLWLIDPGLKRLGM